MTEIDYSKFIQKNIKIICGEMIINGILISIDGYLNLALESVIIEHNSEKVVMSSMFLKGSNVEYLIYNE